jgi:hypothetical protein
VAIRSCARSDSCSAANAGGHDANAFAPDGASQGGSCRRGCLPTSVVSRGVAYTHELWSGTWHRYYRLRQPQSGNSAPHYGRNVQSRPAVPQYVGSVQRRSAVHSRTRSESCRVAIQSRTRSGSCRVAIQFRPRLGRCRVAVPLRTGVGISRAEA